LILDNYNKPSSALSDLLTHWYSKEKRDLPWRESQNPYHIWLSEIILQQTRVAQGLPYFLNFVSHFPKVENLAEADETIVLRLWQGLGYYSRARNLHKAAKIVANEYKGLFPSTYEDLLKLPGVGPYTAAAIASIAFDEVVPVLDGNVFRVTSRLFSIEKDISNPTTRKVFLDALNELISRTQPGDFNQAMMELGATLCLPKNPKCDLCPISEFCEARKSSNQEQFPIKLKKVKVRNRDFYYIVFSQRGNLGLRQRQEKDIWQGLYEFLLVEGSFSIQQFIKDNQLDGIRLTESEAFKHVLTHQRITARFLKFDIDEEQHFLHLTRIHGLEPFTYEQMLNLPKPKLLVNYLNSF